MRSLPLVTAAALTCTLFVGTSSAVVTLGASTQNFVLTGLGGNSSGQGQSRMTWGSCTFDGTNTTCTLSGPFTGFGNGGTYSFTVVYSGNGTFPLNAVSTTPGGNLFFAQATGNLSFSVTLTQANGSKTSFYSFANFNFQFANPTCTGVASNACGVGQVGLTPGATIGGPIVGTFDPTPAITPSGVISAANYGAFSTIAPGTWVEIYGVNLATTLSQTWAGADFVGNQAPSALAGTTVTIGGNAAYIDFVSPAQINVQVPSTLATGTQPLVVKTAGGTSLAYSVNVAAIEPGMLAPPSFILGGKQHVVALFSNTLTYVLPVNFAGLSTARARAGDNITLYGIGFGPVTPDIPAGQIVTQSNGLQAATQITFAGVPGNVTYAGLAPGYVGLYEFNVTVPSVAASDSTPIVVKVGTVTVPQTLVIAIQ